jgi:hypothetical protein
MTHEQLCQKARAWLRGTKRCNPVFSNIASCVEIPDAIGWFSGYCGGGSIVVECKASVSDFYADKKKRIAFKHKEHNYVTPSRYVHKGNEEQYEQIERPLMGDFRYYMSTPDVITLEMVEKNAPDHGLLHVKERQVRVIRNGPRRDVVNKNGEIRYLRFAIINDKMPFDVRHGYVKGETEEEVAI